MLQCLRKAFLLENNIKFYPKILHEDHLFTFTIFMLAQKCKVINYELYNYRIRENSITTKKTDGYKLNFLGMNLSYQKMAQWYLQHKQDTEIISIEKSIIKHLRDMKRWTGWYYNLLNEQERKEVTQEKKKYDEMWESIKREYRYTISVIIPAYNVEKYIGDCLESILRQTFSDYQIIVIDDGSTDDTKKIIKQYMSKYPYIISLYEQENLGPSEARNTGLDVALGKYIFYVDSDDYIMEKTLERLLKISEKNNFDVLLFACQKVIMDKDIILRKEHWGYKTSDLSGRKGIEVMTELLPTRELYDVVWLQFVKQSLLEENKIRFYPGIIHEDHLYTFTVLLNSQKCGYMDEELYYYRIREKSIMTTNGRDDERFVGWAVTFNELARICKNKNIKKEYPHCYKAIKNYIIFCGEFGINLYWDSIATTNDRREYSHVYLGLLKNYILFGGLEGICKMLIMRMGYFYRKAWHYAEKIENELLGEKHGKR